jgi:DNA-binding SARP family transcriptional activator
VDFRILGSLEVVDGGGRRLDLGAPRQRAVLAILLVNVNSVVSIDRLIDELWGEAPPSAATSSLQAYVSNLRRVLEPDRPPRTSPSVLVTAAPGYSLRVPAEQVDAIRFEQLVEQAREELAGGEAATALASFEQALGMWRGDALADFTYEPFAAALVGRLHELRAAAEEGRVEAQLRTGDVDGALATLGRLVPADPLRERLRALQIRALYGAARQADALRVYDEARRLLADELGVEPGTELQSLHRQVLAHDPELDPATAPALTPLMTPATHDRADGLRRGSAFVGRLGALAELRAAADEARSGHTRIVLVEGEPGIGKTALVEELSSQLAATGVPTYWGRCHDDEGAPPLWPWVQLLRALGVAADDLAPHVRSALASLLPELGPATGVDLMPDAARFRLYDAIREAIVARTIDRPVALALDDVQWADASSLRLLQFLSVELREAPVLMVATLRDTEVGGDGALAALTAEAARQPGVERLRLAGLTEHDVAELLGATTDVDADDLARAAASVHRRTSGNPFFITELVRLMRSERRLVASGAGEPDVPTAVGDVVRRRVHRLPDDVQTVLGVAAVIGRQFDLDVLAHACGLDAERTLEAMEAALVTRIVVEDAPTRFEFAHAIVSETLYADLAPARRMQLHGRVAAAIETSRTNDVELHARELARHFSLGPASGSAHVVHYARVAAEEATRRMAYEEAALDWRLAHTALERTDGVTDAEHANVLLELAGAERRAGNLGTGTELQDRALTFAARAGDADLLAEAALAYGEIGLWQVQRYGVVDEHIVAALVDSLARTSPVDGALRVRLLTGLAVARYYGDGELEHSLELTREAVGMARRLGDVTLLGTALVELMVMLEGQLAQDELRAVAAELASIDLAVLTHEASSAALARVARLALADGDRSTFERKLEEFARWAGIVRYPDDQLWAKWALTTVAFLHDELAEAEQMAGEAFALHQQLGIWGAHETFALHMLLIWREQGRLAEVAPLVEPLLAQSVHPSAAKLRGVFALDRGAVDEIGVLLGPDPVPRTRDFTWLADVCITAELAAAGGLACRDELYDLLLPFADRVVTMDATFLCLGAAAYFLGLLASSLGRERDAAAHLRNAVRLNEQVGAAPWARRARARLAFAEAAPST